jgi:hypothetical protein
MSRATTRAIIGWGFLAGLYLAAVATGVARFLKVRWVVATSVPQSSEKNGPQNAP